MSTPAVNMLSPDYSQAKQIPTDQVDNAHAAGWTEASKMVAPEGQHKWVPNDNMDDLQKQGWTKIEADGSFNIQPTEGESFEDTMKRAAKAGQWLSNHPEVNKPLMESQTKKAVQAAPLALAAGPAIAGAQIGAISTAAAVPAVIPAGIKGAKAVTSWAKDNPIQAYILYNLIKEIVPKTLRLVKGMPDAREGIPAE